MSSKQILHWTLLLFCAFGTAGGSGATASAKHGETQAAGAGEDYFPKGDGLQVLTVAKAAPSRASYVILTQAVAIKETGPKETVDTFGEVYAFSPATILVHRDEPTRIVFWNLQPDDDHDFMLMDPQFNVLMKVLLPALRETAFTFTFHKEGLFDFFCAMHRPAMNGQILVLPPRGK